MKRYHDIEEIIPHIDNIKAVSKEDAFHFYKYDSEEHKKWLEKNRERKTQEHFEYYEKIFNSREWFFGNIRISSLHLATMCIGPKFLNRLACSKVTCPEFYKINCSCNDSEQIQTPTFKKVILNFNLNRHTEPAEDIINKSIEKGLISDLTIIIMRDEKPPFLPHIIDGNHRLIATGILPNKSNDFVNCYIGR